MPEPGMDCLGGAPRPREIEVGANLQTRAAGVPGFRPRVAARGGRPRLYDHHEDRQRFPAPATRTTERRPRARNSNHAHAPRTIERHDVRHDGPRPPGTRPGGSRTDGPRCSAGGYRWAWCLERPQLTTRTDRTRAGRPLDAVGRGRAHSPRQTCSFSRLRRRRRASLRTNDGCRILHPSHRRMGSLPARSLPHVFTPFTTKHAPTPGSTSPQIRERPLWHRRAGSSSGSETSRDTA